MSKPTDGRIYREADTAHGHITAEVKNGLVTLTLDTNNDGNPDLTATGRWQNGGPTTTLNGQPVNNTGVISEALASARNGSFSERELGHLAYNLVAAKRTQDIELGVVR